ncbi:MAG: hypothetical protein R6T83_10605, partial [Salinibacter sp.]
LLVNEKFVDGCDNFVAGVRMEKLVTQKNEIVRSDSLWFLNFGSGFPGMVIPPIAARVPLNSFNMPF